MKLFKLVLIVFLAMNSFVLHGCKPSIPGTYVNQKDDKSWSVELKQDGTYLIINNKGDEVGGGIHSQGQLDYFYHVWKGK